MKPYQERVVAEENELNDKMNRLYDFLANSEDHLPRPELNLLKIQLAAMKAYRHSLAARIDLFVKTQND